MSFSRVNIGNSLANAFSEISIEAWFMPNNIPTTSNSFQYIVSACDNSSTSLQSVFNLGIAANFNITTSLPSSYFGNSLYFGIRNSTNSARARPIVVANNGAWPEFLRGLAISTNPTAYASNVWINMVGTFDGSQTLLYINGNLVASSNLQPDGVNRSLSGILNTSSIARTIGSTSNGASQFNGRVSSIKIYNRALSESEIKTKLQCYTKQVRFIKSK